MTTKENCATTHCHQKCTLYFHIAIVVLLIGAIAAAIWAGCQVTQMEILKAGGKENWKKLETIMKSETFKERLSQEVDFTLMQLNQANNNEMPAANDGMMTDTMESMPADMNNEMTLSDDDTHTMDITISGDINTGIVASDAMIDANQAQGE